MEAGGRVPPGAVGGCCLHSTPSLCLGFHGRLALGSIPSTATLGSVALPGKFNAGGGGEGTTGLSQSLPQAGPFLIHGKWL